MIDRITQITMAGLLLLSPGLSMAAGIIQLPVTGQTVCFSEKGDVIPCAGTGQDGDKQAGAPLPAARFTVNGNGTVTDNLTGLMWSKHANAPNRALPNDPLIQCANAEDDMSWQQSLDFVKCLNTNTFAGFSDWRLPNLNELESLVNAGVPDSAAFLNSNGFGFSTTLPKSQVQSSDYWSSTSENQFPDSAWDVNLVAGDFPLTSVKIPVDPANPAIDARGVWPVRGASAAPAQLWLTGQAACFNDAGAIIDCAGTGQDGEKLAGAAAPVPRFQANAGATFAIDKLTGLIWTTNTLNPGPAACPNSGRPQGLTWQGALDHVKCLNAKAFLGRSDWRLPNRKELRSLADYGKSGPALSAGNPFLNEPGNTFWTSTTNTANTRNAWTVSMFDGSLNGADKRNTILPAWPVSGPDAAAPALTMNAVTAMTNVATQTVTGTVEVGAIPVVTVSTAATVGPITVTGTSWSCVISNLAEGANTITVATTNVSANTTTLPPATITLDTTPPSLVLNSSGRGKSTTRTISGKVDAGVTPVVTCGSGAIVGPITVTGSTWSCQISGLKAGANNVTVTATDTAGNAAPPQTAALTVLIADGILSGGGAVGITDALKALRIAATIVPASTDDMLHGDVAPPDAQDGKIDLADALMILKKAVGLPSF